MSKSASIMTLYDKVHDSDENKGTSMELWTNFMRYSGWKRKYCSQLDSQDAELKQIKVLVGTLSQAAGPYN